MEAASKSYGAARALREVSLALFPGEVHGLVGEGDSGKSALVEALGGVSDPDSGQLIIDGAPTALRGQAAAIAARVSSIRQQPPMLPALSVAENIFLRRQAVGPGLAEMRRQAGLIFARLGVELDPARPASGLSVADRQIVEIAKAVSLEAQVILMDEPTTVLSRIEARRLLEVIRSLRDDGKAVLFVSHRIEEVFQACQRVSIMRDGHLVRTAAIADITIDQVIHLITGRKLDAMPPKSGDVVLDVESLSRDRVFSDVSFRVHRGEIVAIAGLAGSRRSEIARAVFGLDSRDAGRVKVRGQELPNGSPQAAASAGVAFIPACRRRPGLFRRARERVLRTRWPGSAPGETEAALGRCLARPPAVLIIDEPTRGMDTGTTARVHWLLDRLVMGGTAILMVSSKLPEMWEMADRILGLSDGAFAADRIGRPAINADT